MTLTHPGAVGDVGLDVSIVRGREGGIAEVVETAVVVSSADGVRKVKGHREEEEDDDNGEDDRVLSGLTN